MAELGLMPSARTRLAIQVPTGPKPWEDPALEFFGLSGRSPATAGSRHSSDFWLKTRAR